MSRNEPGMAMTTMSALAEPNRMKIVELLRDGPLTVGEIATGHPWLAIPTAILAACECFEAYDEAKECF